MPDHGTIGLHAGALTTERFYDYGAHTFPRHGGSLVTERFYDYGAHVKVLCHEGLVQARAALDSSLGNPAPSLRVLSLGVVPFRLAVKSGARTAKVDVLQPDANAQRPKLRVKANPAIGLANDVIATAGSATGWQTLSLNFTATADGGVVLELENPDPEKPCWFDNVVLL